MQSLSTQGWPGYQGWDWPSVAPQLELVQQARNELNHGGSIGLHHVQDFVAAMIAIFAALKEDATELQRIETSLTTFAGSITVKAVAQGGL